jgi:hypothetical protein
MPSPTSSTGRHENPFPSEFELPLSFAEQQWLLQDCDAGLETLLVLASAMPSLLDSLQARPSTLQFCNQQPCERRCVPSLLSAFVFLLCSCNLCQCDADRHDPSLSEVQPSDDDPVEVGEDDDANPTANAGRPSDAVVHEHALSGDLLAWDPGHDDIVRPFPNVPQGVIIAWENSASGDAVAPAPGLSPATISRTSSEAGALVHGPSSEQNRQASQAALLENRLRIGQLRATFVAQSGDDAQRLDELVGLDL